MIKPGQYAMLKDGRTVVVLSIQDNKALVRCFRNEQGESAPVKMRISMSELTELTPVMQDEIRKRSVENRRKKQNNPGVVPAVPIKRHSPPAIRKPHQNDPVCPECGAQGYVDGVKCPNCEHIGYNDWHLPTFKEWLDSQP